MTLAAWQRAGFTAGNTPLDIGCGPGYAALDLAELAGPAGRVAALDLSPRFLCALEAARGRRGLQNITTHEVNLDEAGLPELTADGGLCRWVLAFLRHPRDLVSRLAKVIRPGGVLAKPRPAHA